MRFENEVMPAAYFKSYKRKMAKAVKTVLGPTARNWLNTQLEHSNELRLRQRLVEVANYAGPSLAVFVGDVDTWARIVAMVRNRMTHDDPSQRIERKPGDLIHLGESIYIVT